MKEDVQREIALLREGDEHAFQRVYEATKDDVYRTVAFLANRSSDVADIVSEVYVELIRSIDTYNESLPFRQWLYGLTARQTANWNRKVWRYFRTAAKEKQFATFPAATESEEVWLRKEHRRELAHEMKRLSAKLRTVVVMRYYHEMTFPEIATALNVPLVQYADAGHMLSPTGTLQSATWIGGGEMQPVLYQLSTYDERLTSSDLQAFVEALIP